MVLDTQIPNMFTEKPIKIYVHINVGHRRTTFLGSLGRWGKRNRAVLSST